MAPPGVVDGAGDADASALAAAGVGVGRPDTADDEGGVEGWSEGVDDEAQPATRRTTPIAAMAPLVVQVIVAPSSRLWVQAVHSEDAYSTQMLRAMAPGIGTQAVDDEGEVPWPR